MKGTSEKSADSNAPQMPVKSPSKAGIKADHGGTSASRLPSDSPFLELNAIVLAIEWEIDDSIMRRFLQEIEKLKKNYRTDKILYSFLQLHGSVGKYVRDRKVSAHPDSIKLLLSIYKSLEKIVSDPSIGESGKKRILSAEIRSFKSLKEKILKSKSESTVKKPFQQKAEINPAVEPVKEDGKKSTTGADANIKPPSPAGTEIIKDTEADREPAISAEAAVEPETPSEPVYREPPREPDAGTQHDIDLKQFIKKELERLRQDIIAEIRQT